MALPNVRGEFRLVADPELRFTPSGKAVASFRLVADKQKKNEATGEWEKAGECWLNATAWEKLAENVAESFVQGDLVIIEGDLETRPYETREGEKRTSLDVTVRSAGHAIRWNPSRQERTQRGSSAAQPAGGGQPQPAAAGAAAPDPWATPAGQTEEPPF